jgi:steroid delta-isomerase-like uncharacterized protein
MKNPYPTLVHEWFEEVWNRRDAGTIDRLLGADAIVHGIAKENETPVRGPGGFKEFHRRFLEAFPDLSVEVVETVSEGNKIAARCIVRGTHRGGGLGFAATGKTMEFTGMGIALVSGGKIVEAWNNFDFLTMYSQLGVLDKLSQSQS